MVGREHTRGDIRGGEVPHDQARDHDADGPALLTIELVAANEAQPKIVAALQAGGGPDAMLLQWTWAHLYADKLSDVGTVAEKVGSDGGGFYDAAKQNAQVQGVWRAVPFGITGNAVHYRESLLKQAGGDKFPATWSDLTKVG